MHDGNWMHRDIKHSNIVLTADQRVVFIDFRSACKFTCTVPSGMPQYATPEQYSKQARFGPYTDAFSLGGTLYHALMGGAAALGDR